MAGADAVATGAAAANQGNAAAQTGEAAANYNGASAEYNAPSAEYNGADAAAAGNAAITPTDDSCVSISPAANDYWCQTTCANPSSCPLTMCKCGGEAQASPSPLPQQKLSSVPEESPAADPSSVYNAPDPTAAGAAASVYDAPDVPPVPQLTQPDPTAAGATAAAHVAQAQASIAAATATDESCVSISPAANDYWCQTMCVNEGNACPPTLCKCGEAATSPSPLPKKRSKGSKRALRLVAPYPHTEPQLDDEGNAIESSSDPDTAAAAGADAVATGADAAATGAAAADQGAAAAGAGASAEYNAPPAEYNAPTADYSGADAAAAGNAAITPTDDSCVSISPAANDYWCQTMCVTPANCP